MDHHHHHHHQFQQQHIKNDEKQQQQSPQHEYPFDNDSDSSMISLKRGYAFFAEWILLILTCSFALFFFPLTPSFTLHSITSSSSSSAIINNNHHHDFVTANLTMGIQVEDSNPVGSAIHYDSLTLSLFHHQHMLSSFNLLQQQEDSSSINNAMFHNVSFKIDEWENNNNGQSSSTPFSSSSSNCGFVYLDIWFNARVRYFQPLLPSIRDKLEGNCGEMKLQICGKKNTNTNDDGVIVQPVLGSCDVNSELVYRVRFLLSVFLILLLVTAVAVPFLIQQFFCSNSDT
ncbi:hypothetical protein PIB30_053726 [Stylosanthes scabra]|uniref:Transmembrane protein n=1 Tax=Stylosanthes scabra TaxID=79078 RepID=A0ABU6UM05_9FABA|nr:hypothetical protein [Stylosanthes scabra]